MGMLSLPEWWNKDWLVYVAFTVDALNTCLTFPLFVVQGPKWVLESIATKDMEVNVADATDRPSFQLLWDVFMVCYEGYFGFTISTLICIYRFPETIPVFAYSLFALYLYKLWFFGTTMKEANDAQTRGKLWSVACFFLPCYGGYCLLHALGH